MPATVDCSTASLRGLSEEQCPRQELDWIIQATRSSELPTILTVAETGMRRSEVVGIQREHLDLMHGVVHLPHQERPRGGAAPPLGARRCWVTGKPMRGRIFSRCARARSRAPSSARDAAPACAMKPCAVTTDGVPTRPISATCAFMRHEGTSQLATVFQIHELAKVNGNVDTRMLRYYHPHGRELAQKLARSPLGKRQLEQLRRERLEGLDALPLAA